MEYIVVKAMNNNVVLAMEKGTQEEVILMGKGLGFNKKHGQKIQKSQLPIERIFKAQTSQQKEDYTQRFKGIDQKIVGACAEIVSEAEKIFGSLSEKLLLVLTDHISFAIERIQSGQEISNPFLYETKLLYPECYAIGVKAQALLKKATGVNIPESEIGFITLHLHAARFKKNVKDTVKTTRIIQELISIIEIETQVKLKRGTVLYDRLLSHLWYCLDRVEKGETLENPMGDFLLNQFPQAFDIAKIVANHIELSLKKPVLSNELLYMTIHIERLRKT